MGSRPIPSSTQQQSSVKNPPLATSLDIQFSYKQRQLPPGEQVVGSNPSFLAFSDHDLSSPYAYDEDDEDESLHHLTDGSSAHGRRQSEDWWEGSETDDDPHHDTSRARPDEEETPRPVHQTLPAFPFPPTSGRLAPSPDSLARPSSAPNAAHSIPPSPRRTPSATGYPSQSLTRSAHSLSPASPSRSPTLAASTSSKANTSPTVRSTSRLAPLWSVLEGPFSRRPRTGRGELKPLLPHPATSPRPGLVAQPSSSSSSSDPRLGRHASASSISTQRKARQTRRFFILVFGSIGAILLLVGLGTGLIVGVFGG